MALFRCADSLLPEGQDMESDRAQCDEALTMVRIGIMGHRHPKTPDQLPLYDPLSDCRAARTGLMPDGAGMTEWAVCSPARTDPQANTPSAETAVLHADPRYYLEDPRCTAPAWNLELTESCTLFCRHCYQEPIKCEAWQRGWTADGSAWQGVVDGLLACEPSEVSLTGGEVMLFPSLLEVLTRLRAFRPALPIRMLLSGMSLWQRRSFRELLPSLTEHRVLVKVPIYSCRDAEHDWVTRSPGSLADSLRLIEQLQRSGVQVLVSYLMLQRTQTGIMETCEFLRKLVGQHFVISTLVYPRRRSRPDTNLGSHLLDATAVRTLLQNAQFSAIPTDYLSFQPPCQSGCRFPMVTIAGEVYGCTVCAASSCGDVQGDSASLARANDWRPANDAVRRSPRCDKCVAQSVCKQCCCFVGSGEPEAAYCRLVQACAEVVLQRIRRAIAEGMRFLHEDAKRCWEAWEARVSTGEQAIAS